MPKGTILDRLAGAMETLGKREGKSLTPRPRDIDFGQSMSINPEDYPEFPSFDAFPDWLADEAPWRR